MFIFSKITFNQARAYIGLIRCTNDNLGVINLLDLMYNHDRQTFLYCGPVKNQKFFADQFSKINIILAIYNLL